MSTTAVVRPPSRTQSHTHSLTHSQPQSLIHSQSQSQSQPRSQPQSLPPSYEFVQSNAYSDTKHDRDAKRRESSHRDSSHRESNHRESTPTHSHKDRDSTRDRRRTHDKEKEKEKERNRAGAYFPSTSFLPSGSKQAEPTTAPSRASSNYFTFHVQRGSDETDAEHNGDRGQAHLHTQADADPQGDTKTIEATASELGRPDRDAREFAEFKAQVDAQRGANGRDRDRDRQRQAERDPGEDSAQTPPTPVAKPRISRASTGGGLSVTGSRDGTPQTQAQAYAQEYRHSRDEGRDGERDGSRRSLSVSYAPGSGHGSGHGHGHKRHSTSSAQPRRTSGALAGDLPTNPAIVISPASSKRASASGPVITTGGLPTDLPLPTDPPPASAHPTHSSSHSHQQIQHRAPTHHDRDSLSPLHAERAARRALQSQLLIEVSRRQRAENALATLEAAHRLLGEAKRGLEEEKKEQGVKTTRAIIDAQREAMEGREEGRRWGIVVGGLEEDVSRAQASMRQLEAEKEELERELIKVRSTARTLKEQTLLLQAKEEGRREGYEEGLRQGRMVHGVVDLSLLSPEDREAETKRGKKARQKEREKEKEREREKKEKEKEKPKQSLEGEIERENLRKIDEKENLRVKLQLNQVERELDKERQRNKEAEAEKRRLVDERARVEEEKQRLVDERVRMEAEMRARLVEEVERVREDEDRERRRLVREMEREREEEREEERAAAAARRAEEEERRRAREEEEDAHRERVARRGETAEAEAERRESEMVQTVAKAAAIAVAAATATANATANVKKSPEYTRVPYIAMMPPPVPPSAESSAGGSRQGHGRHHGRRTSVGSYASSTSSAPMEMLQSPPGAPGSMRSGGGGLVGRAGRMSVIREVDGHGYGNEGEWGAPSFPEVSVPRIVPPGGSATGSVDYNAPAFPQVSVPNIVPPGGSGSAAAGEYGAPSFPQISVPQIVPPGPPGSAPGAGVEYGAPSFPQISVPQIVPPGGSGAGGSGAGGSGATEYGAPTFPQISVPQIVSAGGQGPGATGGEYGAPSFPQPTVPQIVPSGGAGGAGEYGTPSFPNPTVPHIVPPRSGPSPAPGSIPDLGGRQSSIGPARMQMPTLPGGSSSGAGEPTGTSTLGAPRPGVQMPTPGGGSTLGAAMPGVQMPSPGGASSLGPAMPGVQMPSLGGDTSGAGLLHPTGYGIYGPPQPGGAQHPGLRRGPGTGSSSSIQIHIEPPSRPPSSISPQGADGHAAAVSYLSPNHRPITLPSQDAPTGSSGRKGASGRGSSYDYDAQQSTSPVIPGVTVPMPSISSAMKGSRNGRNNNNNKSSRTAMGSTPTPPAAHVLDASQLPPGFVPQSITDARGVSTPIVGWGGGTALPVVGSAGSAGSAGGKYGNPLNKDRDEDGVSIYGPPLGGNTAGGGGGWGKSPGPVMPASLPSSSSFGFGGASTGTGSGDGWGGGSSWGMDTIGTNDDDTGVDVFDHQTTQNTLLNARSPVIPGAVLGRSPAMGSVPLGGRSPAMGSVSMPVPGGSAVQPASVFGFEVEPGVGGGAASNDAGTGGGAALTKKKKKKKN